MDRRLFLLDEELDHGVGLILAAERQLRGAVDQVRQAAELSQSEMDVLLAIRAHPGCVVGDLRNRLNMTAPTFARILGRVDGRDLVRKQRGRIDGRQRRLYLSDAADTLMTPIVEALRDRVRTAYRIAGAESVAGARAMLDALTGADNG
ncbi:MAG: MarR family winged helix-turn-helix transcriptional regulator [Hyphomonadaceae bacterium]